MATYRDDRFVDKRIVLDGHSFHNCEFEQCSLIYEGGMDVELRGCKFVDCRWTFGGAAARTVQFMSALYASGEGGRTLIEHTFNDIRKSSTPSQQG